MARTHGRRVGICYQQGKDIAEALIRAGLARDCPGFSGGRYALQLTSVYYVIRSSPPLSCLLSLAEASHRMIIQRLYPVPSQNWTQHHTLYVLFLQF